MKNDCASAWQSVTGRDLTVPDGNGPPLGHVGQDVVPVYSHLLGGIECCQVMVKPIHKDVAVVDQLLAHETRVGEVGGDVQDLHSALQLQLEEGLAELHAACVVANFHDVVFTLRMYIFSRLVRSGTKRVFPYNDRLLSALLI